MVAKRRNRADPPRVCAGCKFGVGIQRDCSLIQASRIETLLDEGPCQFSRRVKSAIDRSVAENFPQARRLAPLFGEKAVFRLQILDDFPGEELARLPEVLIWLERFSLRFVAELLEEHDDIEGLRCGRCRHRDPASGRCGLEFAEGPKGRLDPHPWFGKEVDAQGDPLQLAPSCDFFAAHGPAETDPLAEILAGLDDKARASIVLNAIDRLADESMTGMAQAVFIQRHAIRGEAIENVADSAGLDHESARRLYRAARSALLEILEEDAPDLVDVARHEAREKAMARS
jgi:hypothetical protein